MYDRAGIMCRIIFLIAVSCLIAGNGFAEEGGSETSPLFIISPGYDFTSLNRQTIHTINIGADFLLGDQDMPFDEVYRRFEGSALYEFFFFEPFLSGEKQEAGIPQRLHRIEAVFDGRIYRHQLYLEFKSFSDRPIAGGLATIETKIGWGYEIIRRPHMSLILGGLGVIDFGEEPPARLLPLLRFELDAHWFDLSFDFIKDPSLSFSIDPGERFLFTADMWMREFRSIRDLGYEFTLWYRLFGADRCLGDFAGIGAGIKNDGVYFEMSRSEVKFELWRTSIFATVALPVITIQGGWVFDSRYLLDGVNAGSPGRGFFISAQGSIPIHAGAFPGNSRRRN